MFTVWLACTAPQTPQPDVASPPTAPPVVVTSPPTATSPAPSSAPLACPTLVEGDNTFEAAGLRRRVIVHLPPTPTVGMPALFFFHGIHQRAEDMVAAGELARLADEAQVITVAPDSADRDVEAWIDEEDGIDAQLFDLVTGCLIQELAADPDQIHVAGFSGGGVFATWLILHRAPVLASALPFSGGLDGTNLTYVTPEAPLPVLLSWGGEADTGDAEGETVYFAELSTTFGSLLADDGHLVVYCDHGDGHRVPDAAPDLLVGWSLAHRRGEPSPFEGPPGSAQDLTGLPNYCVRAAP